MKRLGELLLEAPASSPASRGRPERCSLNDARRIAAKRARLEQRAADLERARQTTDLSTLASREPEQETDHDPEP